MININIFKAKVQAISKINRTKVVSIEEARQKVVDKLEANSKFITEGEGEVDAVFAVNDGSYTIGAKYGNRWLPDLFGEGKNYITGITKDEVPEVVSDIKSAIIKGDADESIRKVMSNGRRRKVA